MLKFCLDLKELILQSQSSHRQHMAFLGGCILAEGMKDDTSFWIKKSDFDEVGIDRLAATLYNKL